MMMVLIHESERVTGDMVYVVVHREERSDRMMMVVPNHIFSKKLIISLANVSFI